MLPTVETKNDKVFITFRPLNENFTRIRVDHISGYRSAFSTQERRPFLEVFVNSLPIKMYFGTQVDRDAAVKLIEMYTTTV